MTLADHAEAWWKEHGRRVPRRGSAAWDRMYLRWINYAFPLPKRAIVQRAVRRSS